MNELRFNDAQRENCSFISLEEQWQSMDWEKAER